MTTLFRRARFRRDHRWTPSHISPYLEGDLGRSARSRVGRHTADCPECRALLLSMQRMLARLTQSTVSATPDLASAVRRRLSD